MKKILGFALTLLTLVSAATAAPLDLTLVPSPPALPAKSYVLLEANSGKVLASKNANERVEPASLTKMMTLYIVSHALKQGRITLEDQVPVSKKAWKMGGSKMFIRAGSQVPLKKLIQGVIVASGNDACVALAEYVAGNEEQFAQMMNQTAAALGMNDTHFVDSTGMPDPNHYTTAHDMAVLAQALVRDFPEYYGWYKQKWFKYNKIKQPNRNRLLWRDPTVDGLKTGHTKSAGYCLVASAARQNIRLISVLMGAKSDAERASLSQRLLNYGFNFFETNLIYQANTPVSEPRVWQGETKTVPAGFSTPVYATLPKGQSKKLQASVVLKQPLTAPIAKGDVIGELKITLDDKTVGQQPLVALADVKRGGFWRRMSDKASQTLHHWFKKS